MWPRSIRGGEGYSQHIHGERQTRSSGLRKEKFRKERDPGGPEKGSPANTKSRRGGRLVEQVSAMGGDGRRKTERLLGEVLSFPRLPGQIQWEVRTPWWAGPMN